MLELMKEILLTVGMSALLIMLVSLFLGRMAEDEGMPAMQLAMDIAAVITSGILILECLFVLGYFAFGAIWGWY